MSENIYIAIGSSLVSAVVAMAIYIKHLHKSGTKDGKDNLIMMVNAMNGNAEATKSITKVMDEMKSLIHTVNERLIKIDLKP